MNQFSTFSILINYKFLLKIKKYSFLGRAGLGWAVSAKYFKVSKYCLFASLCRAKRQYLHTLQGLSRYRFSLCTAVQSRSISLLQFRYTRWRLPDLTWSADGALPQCRAGVRPVLAIRLQHWAAVDPAAGAGICLPYPHSLGVARSSRRDADKFHPGCQPSPPPRSGNPSPATSALPRRAGGATRAGRGPTRARPARQGHTLIKLVRHSCLMNDNAADAPSTRPHTMHLEQPPGKF